MKIHITLHVGKMPKILGVIEVSKDELDKHKCQKLTLVLNKLTDYMLSNAKRDDVVFDYLNNLNLITYVTDDNIKIDLLD